MTENVFWTDRRFLPALRLHTLTAFCTPYRQMVFGFEMWTEMVVAVEAIVRMVRALVLPRRATPLAGELKLIAEAKRLRLAGSACRLALRVADGMFDSFDVTV